MEKMFPSIAVAVLGYRLLRNHKAQDKARSKQNGNDAVEKKQKVADDGFEVCTSRMMLPDDANPNGHVYGGAILSIIEQSTWLLARRHCGPGVITFAAPRVTFQNPAFIGALLKVEGKVVHVEDRYVEVKARVLREDIGKKTRWVLTGTATVYFYKKRGSGDNELPPPLPTVDPAAHARCTAIRAMHRRHRTEQQEELPHYPRISRIMFPSDCRKGGIVFGGTLMKMMDDAAAEVCGLHVAGSGAKTSVTVTAEDIMFLQPCMQGDVVWVSGAPIFTSSRTLEIKMWVWKRVFMGKTNRRELCATARYTFVALDKKLKAMAMPPYVATTEQEKQWEAEAKTRYLAAKMARMKKKKKHAARETKS